MSDAAQNPLERIARGLAQRMAQVRRAEEQLAAFAWKENASGAPDGADSADYTSWVVRALHVASEGDNHRVLRLLASVSDATVADLSELLGVGRAAAVDRVSALTQAGLVARDLESDRVGLTELGSGVVALLDELALRVRSAAGKAK